MTVAASAAARELASPALPSPLASPAPPARQRVTAPTPARKQVAPAAVAATSSTSREDLDTLENVIDLIRKHRPDEATQAEAGISDPVARKLAEWLILRSDNNNANVERYRAFLSANPSWPSQTFLRRRLEAQGKRLIDTTCPLVARVHQAAKTLQAGPIIFFLGNKEGSVEFRKIEIKELPPEPAK